MNNATNNRGAGLRFEQHGEMLTLRYTPNSGEALFDICDQAGHILKSGGITGLETRIRIAELMGEELYVMVLDGDESTVKPLSLRKAS
ncbi:MAG: hypothetical protein ABI599_08455 [Flavobacteriales bacterium]